MCQTMTPKIIFLCFITIHIVASFQLSKPSSLTQFRHDSIPKNRYFKSNDDDFVKEAMTKKSRVLKSTPIKNLIHVETLEEFVNIMKDRSATVVVARFYAPWCKACSSIAPSYHRLARRNPKATFLDIAVTSKDSDLPESLNIPFVPYGHVYNNNKLVNEMSISKSVWREFESTVKNVIVEGDWEVDNA